MFFPAYSGPYNQCRIRFTSCNTATRSPVARAHLRRDPYRTSLALGTPQLGGYRLMTQGGKVLHPTLVRLNVLRRQRSWRGPMAGGGIMPRKGRNGHDVLQPVVKRALENVQPTAVAKILPTDIVFLQDCGQNEYFRRERVTPQRSSPGRTSSRARAEKDGSDLNFRGCPKDIPRARPTCYRRRPYDSVLLPKNTAEATLGATIGPAGDPWDLPVGRPPSLAHTARANPSTRNRS